MVDGCLNLLYSLYMKIGFQSACQQEKDAFVYTASTPVDTVNDPSKYDC